MSKIKNGSKRMFVLDTNVLMHDPYCLLHFHEHDIYLPMVVLEELDAGKKGLSEVARNVRQVNRFLELLIQDIPYQDIIHGVPIRDPKKPQDKGHYGRLFFQTADLSFNLPRSLPGHKADHTILAATMALQKQRPDSTITLVSKDINLRLKAGILGVHAEDYYNDKVLDNIKNLHSGLHALPDNFWEKHSKDMHSWQESGHTFYKIIGPLVNTWMPNDFIYTTSAQAFNAIVRKVNGNEALIEIAEDYSSTKHAVWGIVARNREQSFALNLLLDPEVDFVTLQGSAGSGKTLLTLAAGLTQTLETNRYREIIMTRVTVPLGEDIGFLPGTEEEKMTPWMGSLMDNLEVLHNSNVGGNWGRTVTQDILLNRIKVRSLNFMRGRTFLNKYIIIDEAQNLTSKQIKTLVTRAGPGTKMVLLGDLAQIDTPYLTEVTSGLTYAIDRFKQWEHSGHVTMLRGERSRLADQAAMIL